MIDVTEEDVNQKVLDTEGLALLYFTASWCGPCRMLKPNLERWEKELDGKVNVLRVDVDAQSEIARNYNIMSVPTMIALKDGSPVKTVIGVQSQKKLTEEFSDYLN